MTCRRAGKAALCLVLLACATTQLTTSGCVGEPFDDTRRLRRDAAMDAGVCGDDFKDQAVEGCLRDGG